jgi:hypothetical protein
MWRGYRFDLHRPMYRVELSILPLHTSNQGGKGGEGGEAGDFYSGAVYVQGGAARVSSIPK